MAVMPVVMMPMVMMPATPMVMVPPMVMPVPMMMPAYLLGLEAIDLILSHDRGRSTCSARRHAPFK
jgi:hypothetical protein